MERPHAAAPGAAPELDVGRSILSLPAANIIGPCACTHTLDLPVDSRSRRMQLDGRVMLPKTPPTVRTGPRTSVRTELQVVRSGGLLELRTICCRRGAPPITRLVVRCIRALPPARPSGSDVRPTNSLPESRRARATALRGVPLCDCASGWTAAGSKQQPLLQSHRRHAVQHDDADGGTGPASAIASSTTSTRYKRTSRNSVMLSRPRHGLGTLGAGPSAPQTRAFIACTMPSSHSWPFTRAGTKVVWRV